MARGYVYEDNATGWRQMVETDMPNSGVTAATYGDATHVPQIAVNAQGFITSASNVAITGGGGSSPLTTKGDVWGYSTADARIPVGSDGQVLQADSTQALGVKWGAVPSGSGGATTLLASSVLAAPAASFDFTSISGAYSALLLEMLLRGATGAGTFERVGVRFNNDSTANHYGWAFSGSSSASNAMTDTWIQLADAAGNGATAGAFGAYTSHIPFYAGASNSKIIHGTSFTDRLATGIFGNSGGGLWTGTAAITRITILPATNVGGNWATGSAVSIYGLS